jgi:hypothetical protein
MLLYHTSLVLTAECTKTCAYKKTISIGYLSHDKRSLKNAECLKQPLEEINTPARKNDIPNTVYFQ